MWFRVRYLTHQVTWLIDHVITWYARKAFISTFARTMTTNFSKVWLNLSWPQLSSHVTHLSCDYAVFAKRWISSFTTQMTIELGRVTVRAKGTHQLFQVPCWSGDYVLFEKRHLSTNSRPQNSAGDIKHRKNHNSKACFVIKKILTFDSHQYTPL